MHRNAPSSPSQQQQQRPLMQTQAITLPTGIALLLYASTFADVLRISSVTVFCVVTRVEFKLIDAAVMNFSLTALAVSSTYLFFYSYIGLLINCSAFVIGVVKISNNIVVSNMSLS